MAKSTKKKFKFQSDNLYKKCAEVKAQFKPKKKDDKVGYFETENEKVADYLRLVEGVREV